MKDVLGILEHLGYRELRPEDTDETHVLTRKRKPRLKRKATCRLVDRGGPVGPGQLVATARKSCLVDWLRPKLCGFSECTGYVVDRKPPLSILG